MGTEHDSRMARMGTWADTLRSEMENETAAEEKVAGPLAEVRGRACGLESCWRAFVGWNGSRGRLLSRE